MQVAFVDQCRHNIAIVDSISVPMMHFPFVNLNVGNIDQQIQCYVTSDFKLRAESTICRSMSAQHCICRFDQCVIDAICIYQSECRQNIDQEICYVTS